jgi:hypothetical protein
MAMIEINKNPSPKELRTFGLLFVAFAALLGLSIAWRHSLRAAEIVWLVGAIIGAVYFAIAAIRKPAYLGWCYATYPIGWTVSHVVMLATFYLAVTPVALVLRLMGRDLLNQRIDRSAATYWVPHAPSDVKRYFRQF